ncbi:MAG TPA: tetratricopeptide repeat protein [Anaerovoracaceae bacterium]|nr:tetratricopeptide repeat protein [Anaerovoracaceae bacterium]
MMLQLPKKREAGAELPAKKTGSAELPQPKPEDYDIRLRPDRVGQYFKKYAKDFVFDELSDAFIKRAGLDYLKGVPIPLRKEDLAGFRSGEGVEMKILTMNIAWIMGVDPKFQYMERYLEFMRRHSGNRIVTTVVKKGRDIAEKEDYYTAAIYFRAALCIDPDNLHAMYSYARACRELYLAGESEEYVGRFKAECIEFFELITMLHPRHALSYYYLGYCYLNMGLYVKAKLAWERFVKITANFKESREIKNRLQQIEEPVRIEEGCNAVLSGRYELGINILEPYLKTKFKDWWPMSYYLGVAYVKTGNRKDAVASFKRVLGINASHVESMEELAEIYAESKDKENETKYRKKAELIRSGGHKEEQG